MAFENDVLTTSFPVTVDLSANIYRAVKLSSGNAVLAGVADVAIGTLQNKPNGTAGGKETTASVRTHGITRAISSAAIAEGAKVAPAANGKLRTAVTGDHVLGIALEAAGGADVVISVLLTPGGAPLA